MIQAKILDGKALAASIRADLKDRVLAFQDLAGRAPGLAVILVGDDPASHHYVRNKEKACADVAIQSFKTQLPASISKAELITTIEDYNKDPLVDGILLQLPLPSDPVLDGLSLAQSSQEIIDYIHPDKDVDGLTTLNLGRLFTGSPDVVYPCTPKACMRLLREAAVQLRGLRALVIGRSSLVGKPIALMLNQANATVTMAHSQSKNIEHLLSEADVVIVAIGKAEAIRGEWLKPSAVVLDVGINTVYVNKTSHLVGDVHFDSAAAKASYITPVPGGVGPMTVAMLLENCYELALRRH